MLDGMVVKTSYSFGFSAVAEVFSFVRPLPLWIGVVLHWQCILSRRNGTVISGIISGGILRLRRQVSFFTDVMAIGGWTWKTFRTTAEMGSHVAYVICDQTDVSAPYHISEVDVARNGYV